MGTGKTVVGKKLAKALAREFIDIDALIEGKVGMSIPQIFEQFGEPYFREREKEMIRVTASSSDKVIAIGGGAIVDPENLRNLKKNGIIICLTAAPEVIAERAKEVHLRPLLKNAAYLMVRIKELLAARAPYYARADYQIDTSHLSIEEVVRRTIELLNLGDSVDRSCKSRPER